MKTVKKSFTNSPKDNLIEEYKNTIATLIDEKKKLEKENSKLKKKLKEHGISYV